MCTFIAISAKYNSKTGVFSTSNLYDNGSRRCSGNQNLSSALILTNSRRREIQLAKENEMALRSDDENAKLKRIPPASLVARTGNEWKELSNEVKAQYEVR